MAIKWENVKAGDVLYDAKRCSSYRSSTGWEVWPVRIIEIDHESGRATVSWNNNKPHSTHRRNVENLRRKYPKPRFQR